MRPPRDPFPPFMANTILNFHFDYWNPSLISCARQYSDVEREVGHDEMTQECATEYSEECSTEMKEECFESSGHECTTETSEQRKDVQRKVCQDQPTARLSSRSMIFPNQTEFDLEL